MEQNQNETDFTAQSGINYPEMFNEHKKDFMQEINDEYINSGYARKRAPPDSVCINAEEDEVCYYYNKSLGNCYTIKKNHNYSNTYNGKSTIDSLANFKSAKFLTSTKIPSNNAGRLSLTTNHSSIK